MKITAQFPQKRPAWGLTARQLVIASAVAGALLLAVGGGYLYYRNNAPGQLGARAHLALEQHDAPRALEYLQKALSKNPSGELGLGLRNLMARALLESNPIREVEARRYLAEVLAQKADHPEALDLFAKSYILPPVRKVHEAVKPVSAASAAEIAQSVQENVAALEKLPPTPRNLIARAELHRLHFLVLSDQIKQLSAEVDNAFLSQNQDAANRGKSDVERLRGPESEQQSLALQRLEEALKAEPRNIQAAGLTAQYQFQDHRYSEALAMYEQFQKINVLSDDLVIAAARSLLADVPRQPSLAQRLTDARKVLEAYLKDHPDSPRVQVSLGDILLDQDHIAEAVAYAEKAAAKLPGDLAAQILLVNARLRERKPEDALRLLTPLTTTYSNRPEVWYLLGSAHADAGHSRDARDAFSKALAVNGSYTPARQALLTLEVAAGNGESAAILASQLLRDDRFNMHAWSVTVENFHRQGQSARALQLLIMLAGDRDLPLEAKPDLVRLLSRFGAAEAAEKLLATLPPDDKSTVTLRAFVAGASGNTVESRKLLAEAVAADPADADLRLRYAEMLEAAGLYADVRAQLDALAAKPASLSTDQTLEVARRYLNLRLPTQAQNLLKPMLQKQSEHGQALALARQADAMLTGTAQAQAPLSYQNATMEEILRAGVQLLQQKKFQEALGAARAGLARDKTNASLHQLSALALAGLNQIDQAVEEAVEAARTQPEAVAGYATFVELFPDPQAAMKGLGYGSRVESINPALGGWAMGQLAQRAGDLNLALRYYTNALAATPRLVDSRPAKDALYQAILQLHTQRQDAAALRDAADRMASSDEAFAPGIRLLAADHLLSLGDRAGAQQQLEALSAELTPASRPNLVLGAASRWLAVGQRERAVSLMEKQVAASSQQPELLDAYASLLAQAQNYPKALEVRQQLVALDSGNPQYRVSLGQSQAAVGDLPAAMQTLQEAAALGATGKELAASARARLLISMGLLDQASRELTSLKSAGEDFALQLTVAQAWAQLKKPNEARKLAETIPAYAAEYAPARTLLASLDVEAGRNDAAIAALRELLAKYPHSAPIAAPELFIAHMRQGKPDDAFTLAKQQRGAYIAHTPMWQKWTTLAAAAAREGGNYAQAIALLQELDAETRKQATLDIALMRILENKPQEAAASESLTDAAPDFARSTLRLIGGQTQAASPEMIAHGLPSAVLAALSNADSTARAPETLARNPQVFPGDVDALLKETAALPNRREVLTKLALAQKLLEMGWSTSTLRILDTLSAGTQLSWADVARHQALTDLRRTKQADELRDQLANRLKAGEVPPSVRILLAASYSKDNRLNEALEVLKPLASGPDARPDVLTTLATLHEKLGQLDEAIKIHRQVRQSDPENLAAANNLAYTLAAAHPQDKAALEEARKAIDFAISKAPQLAALQDTLGFIQILAGETQQGTQRIARVLPSLRLEPAVHYHLGLGYSRTGQAALAQLHLQNVAALTPGREQIIEISLARDLLAKLQGE